MEEICTTVQSPRHPGAVNRPKPDSNDQSLVEVQLRNGEMIGMMVSMNPVGLKVIVSDMISTGWLVLHNRQESISINRKDVRALRMTKITS